MRLKVRKAIITAAGLGVRFLPATKAQPKEMLPILNKPIIQYAVEEAMSSGVEQIIIVTSQGKHSLEDHFDSSPKLEEALKSKGNIEALREARSICEGTPVCYIRQPAQLGLGHAVLMAQRLVRNEPFALLLPDDVVKSSTPATRQLMDVYNDRRCCVLGVERVPRARVQDYGIIEPERLEPRLHRVRHLVEKPDPADAPSDLGIVGRYILTPAIFSILQKTLPGKGGEIQLTDALAALLSREDIVAFELEGERHDVGTPLGLLKASIAFALDVPEMRDALREYISRQTAGT